MTDTQDPAVLREALEALRNAHHIPYVDEDHQGGNCADIVIGLIAARLKAEASRRDWAAEAARLDMELESARRGLELIGTRCSNYIGSWTCVENGRSPDAPGTADRWCNECIARTALDGGFSRPGSGGR